MNTRHWMRWPFEAEAGDTTAGGGGDDTVTGDDTQTGGDKQTEPTIEERAAAMGWVPKDKFRGDPSKHVDAATFVKNGLESLPILRERLKKAEQTAADALKTAGEMKKLSDEAFQKGYDKRAKELDAEIRAKAKAGDEEGAAAAADEKAKLEAEKTRRDAKADEDPVLNAWITANDWYKDSDLAEEFEAEAYKLRKRMVAGKETPLEGQPFLDKAKENLKKRFPEKFGNPRRQGAGPVERPSAGGEDGARGAKKGWDQMPADAKEAGERYIKQKLFKDKAAYASSYWAQND